MKNQLVVGLDVGNSKTHVIVTNEGGRVIGVAAGPGVLALPEDPLNLVSKLLDMVEEACGEREGFLACTFAMAGLDLPVQNAAIDASIAAANVSQRATAVNDAFALLRTASGSGDGVAVVFGAGTNCVGTRGSDHVRFHSFGLRSGDWGGGLDIGKSALFVACRSEDGRGSYTDLQERVPQYFGLTRPLQVSEAIQFGKIPSRRLAELAPIVFDAASSGDATARAIVEKVGDEVIAFIEATLKRLGPSSVKTPVLLGGSLLQARNPILDDRIHSHFMRSGAHTEITVADVPPVVGSVLLAFDQLDLLMPDRRAIAEQFQDHLAALEA